MQLTIPHDGIVHFRGVVGTTDGLEFNIAGTVGVPEPTSLLLACLWLALALLSRRSYG